MKEIWKSIFCFLIGVVCATALIWVVAYKLKQPELALTGLLVSIIALALVSFALWGFETLEKLETKKKSKV